MNCRQRENEFSSQASSRKLIPIIVNYRRYWKNNCFGMLFVGLQDQYLYYVPCECVFAHFFSYIAHLHAQFLPALPRRINKSKVELVNIIFNIFHSQPYFIIFYNLLYIFCFIASHEQLKEQYVSVNPHSFHQIRKLVSPEKDPHEYSH